MIFDLDVKFYLISCNYMEYNTNVVLKEKIIKTTYIFIEFLNIIDTF